MRNDVIRAAMKKVPFMLYAPLMDSLLEMANGETPRSEAPVMKIANNSVTYQIIGSIAIIGIDGAMYKKDIGGMCQSVVAYPAILEAIDKAEADTSINTTLFRVDTGGGSVFGADEVEERIYNSKNKTITFFENIGASGGIYIFMASDEVYASETTMLGSIGVKVSYMEEVNPSGESVGKDGIKRKRVTYLSRNAENKDCSLNGNCKAEIESMIDTHEAIFYDRVIKNTGFSEEKIKATFNNGGMIFAKEAQASGFIKEVISFSELLKSLSQNSGSTIVPTASASVSLISDDTTEINQGADMKFDVSSPEATDATEALFGTLVANKTTMENRNDTLKVELQTANAALEAQSSENATLTEKLEATEDKLSEAVATVESAATKPSMETVTARVKEAFLTNVGTETTILAMLEAGDDKASSAIAIAAKPDTNALKQGESSSAGGESKLLTYAKANQGSIR